MNFLKFYTFYQNDVKGKHTLSPSMGISPVVIIEAYGKEDANKRAENIGIYFDGVRKKVDCKCCGDRWSRMHSTHYGTTQPVVSDIKFKSKPAYVHYDGGMVKLLETKARL